MLRFDDPVLRPPGRTEGAFYFSRFSARPFARAHVLPSEQRFTMNENTDVTFKNNSRIHFGIGATDLDKSISFYKELFQAEPSKIKEDYAKFELDDPSINLAIGLKKGSSEPVSNVSHFGIQVKSSEVVNAARERFEKLGMPVKVEEQRICCYAVQDKIWVNDPDGNEWEIFVVTDYNSDLKSDKESECCASGEPQAEKETVQAGCC